MNNTINNQWQVRINQDGNLFIQAKKKNNGMINLFGTQEEAYGICIYSHYLRSVKQLLTSLFPSDPIRSIEAMEALIKEEFCNSRSVSIFKSILEKADIPYRSYSHAA